MRAATNALALDQSRLLKKAGENFYLLRFCSGERLDKSKFEGGTTTRSGWQNAQKQLRQMGLNFSSYTFCQKLRQKIVQIGYLQIRRVGV